MKDIDRAFNRLRRVSYERLIELIDLRTPMSCYEEKDIIEDLDVGWTYHEYKHETEIRLRKTLEKISNGQ